MSKVSNFVKANNLDRAFKSHDGNYTMYSRNGTPDIQLLDDGGFVYKNQIMRGVVARTEEDELVCRVVDAPVLVHAIQLDRLNQSKFLEIMATSDVIGSSSVLVMRLYDDVHVCTNQKMNAYESTWTSNMDNQAFSLGSLWEALMRERGMYDNYMVEMQSSNVGRVDVWWICEVSKGLGISSHVLKYAYTILDGAVGFIEGYNVTSCKSSFVSNNGDIYSDLYKDFPASVTSIRTIDSHPQGCLNSVENVVSFKIANQAYMDYMEALGNCPDILQRVYLLFRFTMISQEKIDLYYKRGGSFVRRQNMSNEIAQLHLCTLAKYNPTYTFSSLFIIFVMVDASYSAYINFVRQRSLGRNSLAACYKPSGASFEFKDIVNKLVNKRYLTIKNADVLKQGRRMTRSDVEAEIIDNIEVEKVLRELVKIRSRSELVNPYVVFSSETCRIRGALDIVGDAQLLCRIFKNPYQDFSTFYGQNTECKSALEYPFGTIPSGMTVGGSRLSNEEEIRHHIVGNMLKSTEHYTSGKWRLEVDKSQQESKQMVVDALDNARQSVINVDHLPSRRDTGKIDNRMDTDDVMSMFNDQDFPQLC